MNVSEAVLEKAARLVDDGRVVLSRRHRNAAMVCGDSGVYEVWAMPDGMTCECYHSTGEHVCSHVVAAMVAFHERDQAEPHAPPVHTDRPRGFAALLGPL